MNTYIKSFERKLQSRFSNYDYNAEKAATLNANTSINQLNRTFTIKVQETLGINSSYTLFGFNENGDVVNGPALGFPSITCPQSSIEQVIRDTAANPVVFKTCKYSTTDTANYSNIVTYRRFDSTGKLTTVPITPLNYQEPQNGISTLVVITDFEGLTLDGAASFTGTINALTTITFVMNVQSKTLISNALIGESIVQTTDLPAPSGNTAIRLSILPDKIQPDLPNGGGSGLSVTDLPLFNKTIVQPSLIPDWGLTVLPSFPTSSTTTTLPCGKCTCVCNC